MMLPGSGFGGPRGEDSDSAIKAGWFLHAEKGDAGGLGVRRPKG